MHLDPVKGIVGTTQGLPRAVGSQSMGLLLAAVVVIIATGGSLAGCAIPSTTAKPFAALSVDPSNVDFGSVKTGSSASHVIQIYNPGGTSLTITGATVSGNDFSITGLTFPLTIRGGSTSIFSTNFAPISRGNAAGSIALNVDASISPTTVSLIGTGVGAAPQLTVSPATLNFGNVQIGNTGKQNGTIANVGSSNATISVVTVAGLGYNVSGVVEGQTVAPGQSLPITVTFVPSILGGDTGSISVASNASNSPTVIFLSGGSYRVDISWSPSATSTVVGYNIYRGTQGNGTYPLRLNSGLVSTTAFTDTSVALGQAYYYSVTAVDSSGTESSYSNPSSATIPER